MKPERADVCVIVLLDFPDSRIGASLKPVAARGAYRIRRDFPDSRIGASLKRIEGKDDERATG